MIKRMLEIILDAYRDKKDKSGDSVLLHAIRVAAAVNEATDGDEEMTVIALAHDLAEDSNVSMAMIAKEFGEEIADCVEILTKKKDEDYFLDYLPRVIANEKCRQVKIRDNMDNSLSWRLEKLPARKADELRRKYEKSWNHLICRQPVDMEDL